MKLPHFVCTSNKCSKRFVQVLETTGEGFICNECGIEYPCVNDIPMLESGLATALTSESKSKREQFYTEHYLNNDRHADIASGYNASEREFLAAFVKAEEIKGPSLEIGCGSGIMADAAPNYIGLDYSISGMLARGFEGFSRVVASAEAIPLPAESCELVFSFNTLEHVPEAGMAFSEIDRILKPCGYVVLKPAWHCTSLNTELIPIKKYSELSFRQRIRKLMMPLSTSLAYKALNRIPLRVLREIEGNIAKSPAPLRFNKLTPYLEHDVALSDADACASIDCHEGIHFFATRRYTVVSHPTLISRIFARNDRIVVQKPK